MKGIPQELVSKLRCSLKPHHGDKGETGICETGFSFHYQLIR